MTYSRSLEQGISVFGSGGGGSGSGDVVAAASSSLSSPLQSPTNTHAPPLSQIMSIPVVSSPDFRSSTSTSGMYHHAQDHQYLYQQQQKQQQHHHYHNQNQQQQQQHVNYQNNCNHHNKRLQSIARYDAFYPQTLACSSPLLDTTTITNPNITSSAPATVTTSQRNEYRRSTSIESTTTKTADEFIVAQQQQKSDPELGTRTCMTSLGAIAGNQGVALFRLSKPHVPLMILSLTTTTSSNTTTTTTSTPANFYSNNHHHHNRATTTTTTNVSTILSFQPFLSSVTPSATTTSSNPTSVTSPSSLYLASSRGSGVLVWDVSGHSLSPLWGRLSVHRDYQKSAVSSTSSSSMNHRNHTITSLAWKTPPLKTSCCTNLINTSSTLLAATTANAASFYDLRLPYISNHSFQPALRFIIDHRTSSGGESSVAAATTAVAGSSPLVVSNVQIACSSLNDECAVLDSAGTLRIYDLRMTDQRSSTATNMGGPRVLNNHTICTIQSYDKLGVGLAYLPTSTEENCWITWGLDSGKNDPSYHQQHHHQQQQHPASTTTKNRHPIVKVWMNRTGIDSSNEVSLYNNSKDATSFDDNSASTPLQQQQIPSTTNHTNTTYRLIGQCSSENLACARVCPSPLIDDTFVTVSLPPTTTNEDTTSTAATTTNNNVHWDVDHISANSNWKAEVWKLNFINNLTLSDDNVHDEHLPTSTGLNKEMTNPSVEKVISFRSTDDTADSMNQGYYNESFLGRMIPRLGALCAAEVGISLPSPRSVDEMNKTTTIPEYSLVLCCLSESGFITTHSIPEALSQKKKVVTTKVRSNSIINTSKANTTKQQQNQNNNVHTTCTTTEREVTVADAARIWRKPDEFDFDHCYNGSNEKIEANNNNNNVNNHEGTSNNIMPFPTEDPTVNIEKIQRFPVDSSFSRKGTTDNVSTGLMPFDMDGISSMNVASTGSDEASPSISRQATSVLTDNPLGFSKSIETTTSVKTDHETRKRDLGTWMANIETDRIPCPRLCGATFSPGVGGLTAFHNGDVGKLWQWWEKTDPTRIVGIPGMIGEAALKDSTIMQTNTEVTTNSQSSTVKITKERGYPRTMKDLSEMNAAATAAQWGEHESDVSSGEYQLLGDNYFDDYSSSSGDSDQGDGRVDGIGDGDETKPPSREFDGHFSDHQPQQQNPSNPPPPYPLYHSSSKLNVQPATNGVGLLSHTLTPLVKVSFQYDCLALNNQCIQLAKGWKLGDMLMDYDFLDSSAYKETEKATPKFGNGHPAEELDVLSPYVSLSPSPVRVHSDSVLSKFTRSTEETFTNNIRIPTKTSNFYVETNKTELLSETSPRPNMQETMVYLKKLFTHQHQQYDEQGQSVFQSHLTPPDRPMLPNNSNYRNRKDPLKESQRNNMKKRAGSIEYEFEKPRIGMHVLPFERKISSEKEKIIFSLMQETCMHNAEVSSSIGQVEKQEIWEQLASIVTNQFGRGNNRCYDGWNGRNGHNALGFCLVDSILRYYESLGDVQMLATIVCVLRVGKRGSWLSATHNISLSLLPDDDDERYDLYIRRYADLLYGWGLLNIRTELNKHLVRKIRVIAETRMSGNLGENTSFDGGYSDEIALVFRCSQCGECTEAGSNFCRFCQDYAFRCAICDNSVRGLFTVCDLCGHGGHVEHMKTWFSKNNVCPTGCGCTCVTASMNFVPNENLPAECVPV